MKRRSNELNIFSMSALDLFASALGAFILIVLILLPYYKKQDPVPPTPESCPTPVPARECPSPIICPAPVSIPTCPVCPTPSPIPVCPPPAAPSVEFADNLLIISMSWYEIGDLDLYVTTPDGTYSYSNEYIRGKPGRFTIDNTDGRDDDKPAIEMWKAYNPSPGSYKVCFKYYGGGDGRIKVGGRLDKPTGPVVISPRRISKGNKDCPLKFEISNDYSYTQISLD